MIGEWEQATSSRSIIGVNEVHVSRILASVPS